jgi:hypothetical protein
MHSAHSPPSRTNQSRKEESALFSLSSLRNQFVQEGRGCTILTILNLFPPGPIGPGGERVCFSHSPPSRTYWSRKGECALGTLSSSLRDQLVQEGRECAILTLLPLGPIGPGRERVVIPTLLPPGPIGPGGERECFSHSPPSQTNWSRKGESALCSLSSLRDQSVPEGKKFAILTLLPPGPISPGR